MKILVVGSGGREHALCSAFANSPQVERAYCADGNAGIGRIAELVPIKPTDIDGLAGFASRNSIDLTFVGGETSLALGIVDEFQRHALRIVGVSKNAARLESSKAFAKDFMDRHSVPTAIYRIARGVDDARQILVEGVFGEPIDPVVVKADGLAAGKGVVVAPDRATAVESLDDLIETCGTEAAELIVLEECLRGREVSLLAFCDGLAYRLMPPVRDHKRIGDGDQGPNTGGMGTIADRSLIDVELLAEIEETIVRPTLKGCVADGFPFRGILFLGLMLTPQGPKVLEYNVRFGDPETQVILPLLESDLTEVCMRMTNGELAGFDLRWSERSAACVVLAAHGYPAAPQKGDIIYGLDLAERHPDTYIYHAGTGLDETGHFVTNGGRVLGVTSTGETLAEALDRAYVAVNDISWNGMQFRHDIGR